MEQSELPFRKMLFVCTNARDAGACCAARDGLMLRDTLKAAVKARGLAGTIRVSQSGCQDRCVQGPNIVVMPDNIWYAQVSVEDIPAILDACLSTMV
jgi:(2Fe-2S) ferredoxin